MLSAASSRSRADRRQISSRSKPASSAPWEVANQGLADYFQFLMSSADYWVRKPHPLILETAALKLKSEPADLWYIGNSPQYDMAAAHNAGMGAIWYNRNQAPCDGPEPHVEVQGWKEFLDLIRKFY